MEFLASDALRGRGSMTPDEYLAAVYIASELRQAGIEPAAGEGYLQRVPVTTTKLKGPASLTAGGQELRPENGLAIYLLSPDHLAGPLQKAKPGEPVVKGSVVLLATTANDFRGQAAAAMHAGAAAVLFADSPTTAKPYAEVLRRGARVADSTIAFLNAEATQAMAALPDGAVISFRAEFVTEVQTTWNVIGVLPGLTAESILLSAHLDHLGMSTSATGDQIYNGADDDASGVTAVLELARTLRSRPKPRRTVYFALFGSEEKGGTGAQYFLDHPPFDLKTLIANLEFEMIGRPDAAVAPGTLWLTGFDRSDLGPALAQHGARIVADPHPAQLFFTRSDNYHLAKKGIVAQTVSSFGLHAEYHTPADDLAHIDLAHMTRSIQSMAGPVRWLAESDFKPRWTKPID